MIIVIENLYFFGKFHQDRWIPIWEHPLLIPNDNMLTINNNMLLAFNKIG